MSARLANTRRSQHFHGSGSFCGGCLRCAAFSRKRQQARIRLHVGLALAGLGLFGLGFYTALLPSIYAQSSFWTSSPTYFAIRVGILMVAFSGMYALACRLVSGSLCIAPLGSVWQELPVLVLDSRRAGLRLCHVGDPSAAASFGALPWPTWRFARLCTGRVWLRDAIVQAWHRRSACNCPPQ